mgnify:FL=1|jgi:hypothetical protein
MAAEEDDSIGITGAVTARVVGRRRVSKRLAFYDLRVEVTDADPTDVLARCTAAGPGATAASRHPDHAELCCKAGAGPLFVDEATLASAQRDALKLGNVVRVSGRWLAGKRGEPCAENVECLEVVERWAETNPGVVFQRDDANKSRAEDHGRKLADDESAPSPSPGTTNAGPTAGDDDKRELKPCKYWLNQGRCHKGDLCAYAHASRETQATWISERKRRRRELAAEDGDPHAEGGGAKTKAKRAEVFVKWLVETFGVETLSKGSGVLDVAGGRGDVSFELHTKRKITCTLVEPRPRKLNKAQHKWLKTRNNNARRAIFEDGVFEDECTVWGVDMGLVDTTLPSPTEPIFQLCQQVRDMFTPDNWHKFADCSVVLGMHPDEATESIVDFAKKFGKPFAVVPCCVFPALFPDRHELTRDDTRIPVTERRQLVQWLADKTKGEVAHLGFEGANAVVYSKTPPTKD